VTKYSSLTTTVALASVIYATSAMAEISPPQDWQVKSLAGITSLQYALGWDPGGKLTGLLKSGLAPLGLPATYVDFQKRQPVSVGTTDALVKIDVDRRGQGQRWVGLYVQQHSRLDRNPAITYDAPTYVIGELVAGDKVDDAVKDLVARFDADFKTANSAAK
jgi:hypothetical protein